MNERWNMKFFSSTSDLKELLLLEHIEKTPSTTQKEIGRVIGGAASMVNVYIDNLEDKDYLVRDYKSAKTVDYNITPQGIKRKNYLLICYMRELMDLYRLAKDNVADFLVEIQAKGIEDVLLYGAGEVAETIIGVIRDKETPVINVKAIVDDDIDKIGTYMLGYKVIGIDDIKDYDHDAVVITSYSFEEEIERKLKEVGYPVSKVERFFSH